MLDIWALINSVAIALISIGGKLWTNGKVKKIEFDYSKKLEEVKSKHSKEQFIHKLLFVKEFKIYEQLWEKLVVLKRSIAKVAEKEISGPNDSRLIDMSNNFKAVRETIENNRPYFDKRVYERSDKIAKSAFIQHIVSLHPQSEKLGEAMDRIKEVEVLLEEIGEIIGEKIGFLREATLIE